MKCRFCNAPLTNVFVDLGFSPVSNAYLTEAELKQPEEKLPLKVFVCDSCFLVQIDEYKKSDRIFNGNYAYFSSYSMSWLQHCNAFATQSVQRFGLTSASHVIEVASNDGYLLQYFQEAGIPVLGVEPTSNTAAVAREKGIESIVDFMSERLGEEMRERGEVADLLVANNVLAHVPDILDFTRGLRNILKQTGVLSVEFPHLLQLIRHCQFDTIYHEHYSYLSLHFVIKLFSAVGLEVFDVEEIPTHGGSLRVFARHAGFADFPATHNVQSVLQAETEMGLDKKEGYLDFSAKTEKIRKEFRKWIAAEKQRGRIIAGYGAAAKGNTFLNFCGIDAEEIGFVSDASPHKQGKFLPGSHIPVVTEEMIKSSKPAYVVILPWNIKDEITQQLSYIREWNGKFVTAIPQLNIF